MGAAAQQQREPGRLAEGGKHPAQDFRHYGLTAATCDQIFLLLLLVCRILPMCFLTAQRSRSLSPGRQRRDHQPWKNGRGSWAPRQLRDHSAGWGLWVTSVAARTHAQVLPLRLPEKKKNPTILLLPNPLVPIRTQGWNALVLNGAVRSGPRGRAAREQTTLNNPHPLTAGSVCSGTCKLFHPVSSPVNNNNNTCIKE